MENIHCLIANIRQTVLADIVRGIANECKTVDVVDRIDGIEDLQLIVEKKSIDVRVLGMKNDVLPKKCSELMGRIANLMVIGLIDDGRRAVVYLNNIGTNEIINIITILGKRTV